MLNLATFLTDVRTLSKYDKEHLFRDIGDIITIFAYVGNLTQVVR